MNPLQIFNETNRNIVIWSNNVNYWVTSNGLAKVLTAEAFEVKNRE